MNQLETMPSSTLTDFVEIRGMSLNQPFGKGLKQGICDKPKYAIHGFAYFVQVAQARFHALPPNRVKLTVEGLQDWLAELGLTERQYALLVDMDLARSVKWNGHWPLTSWLGLIYEMQKESDQ